MSRPAVYIVVWEARGNPIFWIRLFNWIGFGVGRVEGEGLPRPIWWRSERRSGRLAPALQAAMNGYWSVAWCWLAHGRPF